LTTWLVSIAVALVVLAASVLLFLNPVWVGFEQDRVGAAALTGFAPADVRSVTSSILGDLILSTGDFGVTLNGAPVLTDAERSHMRDVRGVFEGFFLLVGLSAIALVVTWRRAATAASRTRWWAAARRGAGALVVVIAVLGVISVVAFDAAFEAFHRLFFAAGSYDFDPRTSHLIQLFPDQFWSDTTIALAVVAIAIATAVAWIAGRRRQGA